MNDRIDPTKLRHAVGDAAFDNESITSLALNIDEDSELSDEQFERMLTDIEEGAIELRMQEANRLDAAELPKVALKAPNRAVSFSYPTLPLDMRDCTHEDLIARGTELAMQFRQDRDYAAIRDEFVRISLKLNQFSLLAPAFRDQPRIPRTKSLWKAYTPLLIDQIVIDCHWLHCRGEKVVPKWPEIKAMFTSAGKFNCEEIAAKIAARGWSCDFRADELMNLSNRQKTQLMQLRDKTTKAKFRELLDGDSELDETGKSRRINAKVGAVRRAITNWIDGNHRVRGQAQIYESIWVAMELLGPDALKAHIAELVGLRCGAPALHARTITDKIGTLQGVLARAGA